MLTVCIGTFLPHDTNTHTFSSILYIPDSIIHGHLFHLWNISGLFILQDISSTSLRSFERSHILFTIFFVSVLYCNNAGGLCTYYGLM